uniref:Uncharacterized protein n=1 Tax=Ciona intestinalis TaxID=7719 RepID=H2XQF7_CIOIN
MIERGVLEVSANAVNRMMVKLKSFKNHMHSCLVHLLFGVTLNQRLKFNKKVGSSYVDEAVQLKTEQSI